MNNERIKWIFAVNKENTCCEATGGAQCCRGVNWAGWCEKPPRVTASDHNPKQDNINNIPINNQNDSNNNNETKNKKDGVRNQHV